MSVTFRCDCGKQLQVADQYAGKQARCPECSLVLSVPAGDHPAPIPAPAKAAPLATPQSNRGETSENQRLSSSEPAEPGNRDSKRKLFQDEDEDDEDRPRRRRRRDEDDEDEDDRPRRRRRRFQEPPRTIWNNRVGGGLVSMVIAIIWFVVGLFFDRFFFYPPILFCFGLVSLIHGLISGRDE
jgi:hypothetical protein